MYHITDIPLPIDIYGGSPYAEGFGEGGYVYTFDFAWQASIS